MTISVPLLISEVFRCIFYRQTLFRHGSISDFHLLCLGTRLIPLPVSSEERMQSRTNWVALGYPLKWHAVATENHNSVSGTDSIAPHSPFGRTEWLGSEAVCLSCPQISFFFSTGAVADNWEHDGSYCESLLMLPPKTELLKTLTSMRIWRACEEENVQ